MAPLLKFVALMKPRNRTAGVAAKARNLLTREEWVYVLSLLVPLVVYNVVLKVVRVATQFQVPGPLGFVDQVRSDLFFNLGYAALWIGLFAVVRSGVPRKILLVLFHLSAVVVVALTTSVHVFFDKTGSMLGFSFVLHSLSSLGDIWKVITSETELMHWIVVPVALVYGTVGPAVITRLVTHRWRLPTRAAMRRGTNPLAAGLAAVFLLSLSLLPSATGAGNAFSRDALANMVVGEIATPEIETKLAADALPTDTRLVRTPEARGRNVVIVVLESTRARSTTAYEGGMNTTPFLAGLARQSLLFERAYAVVPHTSKALVASLCGVPPPLDTQRTESEPDAIPARCLPELLGDHGYRTAFFQSATEKFERRPDLVENLGYEDFYATEDMSKQGYDKANYFGYEDDIMLPSSEEWLRENGDEPFLATYLTVTAHHNYVVPDTYGKRKFAEDDELNRYLNTVRYQDFFLRNLFDQYRELGLYDETTFIVFGDHGEGFEEHGLKQHDNTIYEEGLHIPLVIHEPGRWEGGASVGPAVSELDVLPTVADLLGYEVRGGAYPGTSMLSPPEERTLMASCYHEYTCLASIRDEEKYVYNLGNKADEYFDLSEDPYERNNIIEQQSEEEIRALRDDLLAWEGRVEASYERQTSDERTTGEETTAPE
jgi:lipoteichoic acid synthase